MTTNMTNGFTIAIDGPVASGKGTIAPLLAKRLRGFHLYTGATYRCVALYCIQQGVSLDDQKSVIGVLPQIHIDLTGEKVFLNKKDVTERIKQEDAAVGASKVGVIEAVREAMVKKQREIAASAVLKRKIVIAEGRDTAYRVFPKAELKIFLTARREVRTKRRLRQFREQGDREMGFGQVLEEIQKRDKRDAQRKVDPLVSNPKSHGYFVLDDSDLTQEQTLEAIITELEKKGLQ